MLFPLSFGKDAIPDLTPLPGHVHVTCVALASGPPARDHLCYLHFPRLPQETGTVRFVRPALGSCRCQHQGLGLV